MEYTHSAGKFETYNICLFYVFACKIKCCALTVFAESCILCLGQLLIGAFLFIRLFTNTFYADLE